MDQNQTTAQDQIKSTAQQFETAALQLLEAAVAQFSSIGVTALMGLLTKHINKQAGQQ